MLNAYFLKKIGVILFGLLITLDVQALERCSSLFQTSNSSLDDKIDIHHRAQSLLEAYDKTHQWNLIDSYLLIDIMYYKNRYLDKLSNLDWEPRVRYGLKQIGKLLNESTEFKDIDPLVIESIAHTIGGLQKKTLSPFLVRSIFYTTSTPNTGLKNLILLQRTSLSLISSGSS